MVAKNPPQVPGEVMKTGSVGKAKLVQEAVDRTVSVPSPVGGEDEWKEFHLKQDAGCDLTVEAVVGGFDRDECRGFVGREHGDGTDGDFPLRSFPFSSRVVVTDRVTQGDGDVFELVAPHVRGDEGGWRDGGLKECL